MKSKKHKKDRTVAPQKKKEESQKHEVVLRVKQYELPDESDAPEDVHEKESTKASSEQEEKKKQQSGERSSFLKDDQVSKSLSAIYEGQPTKEWMKTMEHKARKPWVVILFSFLAFITMLSIVAWIGFWFIGMRGFSGEGIEIQIEGPDQISIGQEVSYFINWFNVAREPLAATEFRISFPNDFIVTNIDPVPTSEPMTFRLGAQPVEGRGTVKVSGVFTGALGTASAIQVITNYRPASFNSDFEDLDTKEISYTQSILEGELVLPPKVIPGDEVEITYRVKNTGSRLMERVFARFDLPQGFVPAATTTQESLDAREYFMPIETLDAGEEKELVLKGTFVARSGGDIPIIAEAGFMNGGNFSAAQRAEGQITVLAGDLDLEMVINGNQDDRSVQTGEWQRIAISYQNLSGEELEDVVISLHAQPQEGESAGSLLDWNEREDDLKGAFKENVILFTEEEIEDLAKLDPDMDGFIEVAIPIKSEITKEDDVPLEIYAEARIGSVAGDQVDRTIKTKPIVLRLETDATIESLARYTSSEGAPVGSGPLPPIVGSSTTYRIEWSIQKTLHELDRLSVSANLPPAVIFAGQKEIDAGILDYDSSKKLVTWTINTMPEDVDELLLSFDVTIRPSEADLGRFAQLLGETRLEFTDKKLETQMLRTDNPLTTDIPDDPIAGRKGVVSRE